ncbi:LysE family translocator [Luteolibacter sp. GHJ8]|uniref:LysE family translocator n=1 Tax=Luteolibacter rhizosphaerae TaxID=2989719 RepID=A0ABT3G6Q3_9BACT|nr:LysE family translocator [Luteolibacter rhizosphaerae]MCW1914915.1 LysE family translocator [Luteolibacter rhizosphaerae]
MSELRDLALFAFVMALGQFSPGPDMILLTRTALAQGIRAGVMVALGIATGLVIHTSLAVAGMAVAFERSPVLRKGLAWLAAVYLGWIAYCLLRSAFSKPLPASGSASVPAPAGNPYLKGFACNLFNPKVVVFIAAICAPFLRGEHPSWWPYALIAIVVIQGGGLWALWAALLQWRPLRTRYERSARWIDGAFGIALIALAIKLGLDA